MDCGFDLQTSANAADGAGQDPVAALGRMVALFGEDLSDRLIVQSSSSQFDQTRLHLREARKNVCGVDGDRDVQLARGASAPDDADRDPVAGHTAQYDFVDQATQ